MSSNRPRYSIGISMAASWKRSAGSSADQVESVSGAAGRDPGVDSGTNQSCAASSEPGAAPSRARCQALSVRLTSRAAGRGSGRRSAFRDGLAALTLRWLLAVAAGAAARLRAVSCSQSPASSRTDSSAMGLACHDI